MWGWGVGQPREIFSVSSPRSFARFAAGAIKEVPSGARQSHGRRRRVIEGESPVARLAFAGDPSDGGPPPLWFATLPRLLALRSEAMAKRGSIGTPLVVIEKFRSSMGQ